MTIILLTHILCMITSVMGTTLLLAASVLGYRVRTALTLGNDLITFGGILSGAILLVGHPLDYRCFVLSAYVAAFYAARISIRSKQRAFSL
jgi:hypothetical protein